MSHACGTSSTASTGRGSGPRPGTARCGTPSRTERVVVIGAGPVGQTTALLLARWGLRVLLIDERPARTAVGSRAICQQRDVLDIWESVGAGKRIAEEGVTWTRARIFYRDVEIDSWEFADQGRSPLPPFVNISQARTEQILDELVTTSSLIELRWGCAVTELAQDDTGVTLTCQGEDGQQRLRASYVVACCGSRGAPLRERLGVAFEGETFDDRFLICDVRADRPDWASERRFHFDPSCNPGRQVLIHGCPDSVFRLDWQVSEEFDLEGEERTGALDRRIRDVLGDVDFELVWRSVYRFSSRVADRLRVGRVLLAGDMAHLFAPFGARGLNSGVADAENAAWKVAFVAHGWAGEELLESYHAERHAAALENLDVTTSTMRFLVPRTAAQREQRAAVLGAAATVASTRRRIDAGRFAEPFWYADSPLTTKSRTRSCFGRPPLGQAPVPAPGVLLPDGRIRDPTTGGETWIRRITRDGFTLLLEHEADLDEAARAVALVAPIPLRVEVLPQIDTHGDVRSALGPLDGEVAWLIRPDAHIAAVFPRVVADTVAAAASRACRQLRRRVPVP